jgi:hypothetical protein
VVGQIIETVIDTELFSYQNTDRRSGLKRVKLSLILMSYGLQLMAVAFTWNNVYAPALFLTWVAGLMLAGAIGLNLPKYLSDRFPRLYPPNE